MSDDMVGTSASAVRCASRRPQGATCVQAVPVPFGDAKTTCGGIGEGGPPPSVAAVTPMSWYAMESNWALSSHAPIEQLPCSLQLMRPWFGVVMAALIDVVVV